MKVIVIGACNIDYLAKIKNETSMNDSNPSSIKVSFGGVGKNIAHNLKLLGNNVAMLSVLSTDANGNSMLNHLNDLGIDTSHILFSDKPSSTYIAINDNKGDLVIGVNDMDIIAELSYEYISNNIDFINGFDYVVIDTNLEKKTIKYILDNVKKPIICDAVSSIKAKKLEHFNNMYLLKANKYEIEAITNLKDYKEACNYLLAKGLKKIVVSLGEKGLYYKDENNEIELASLKAGIVNTNGAGDALLASLVHGFSLNEPILKTLNRGLEASKMTLESESSVNPNIINIL